MSQSVLFVCLGNICRSPMAEALFLDIISKQNQRDKWIVDSAAIIDYHLGKRPEPRTLKTLNKHNVTNYDHRVRQVCPEDFDKFDIIFGMDNANMTDLKHIQKDSQKPIAKLQLLGEFDPNGEKIIEDPYYSDDPNAFEITYEHCLRSVQGFLNAQK